ncbi:MAG: hypothetical protein HXS44_13905 [Theionarchaea archaeon]|nr:hypothetical protein [Theionarchaea archaeon]
MSKEPPNNVSFAFTKLRTEVKGVSHVFIYPKQPAFTPKDSLEKKLKALIDTISRTNPLRKISVETFKGGIIIYVTKTFFLGAIITTEANPMLVEMILSRIALNIDSHFETFKTINMRTIEEKIQERIEGLIPYRTDPVMVMLISKNVVVEGEISLIATAQQELNQLREEIQEIVDEEIPFFFRKSITIDIKPHI